MSDPRIVLLSMHGKQTSVAFVRIVVLEKLLEGDQWIRHLNPQLHARLDSYASELIPSSPSINPSNDNRISLNLQLTSSNVSPSIYATSMSPWASSHFIHDMPIVKTIGLLFNISHSQLQKDLSLIPNWCTEKETWSRQCRLCNSNVHLVMRANEWFLPYVQTWLDAVETKTCDWVQSAIRADKVPTISHYCLSYFSLLCKLRDPLGLFSTMAIFTPEGNDCHSTSIHEQLILF
ncbi:hypothetical protein O181_051846 [Austropuccinia psidii MF-1]|uniref:Uncharacterized protein n=1 Tax=Austropuccinia psidii MF-1 TaxID=1389203 RepID=A0A9Q3DX79_9BASI|nr:hypothetical protein [Austropuccinia psidii MF-1]